MSMDEVKLLTQKVRQDVLMIPNGLLIHETGISETIKDKEDKNQKGM